MKNRHLLRAAINKALMEAIVMENQVAVIRNEQAPDAATYVQREEFFSKVAPIRRALLQLMLDLEKIP